MDAFPVNAAGGKVTCAVLDAQGAQVLSAWVSSPLSTETASILPVAFRWGVRSKRKVAKPPPRPDGDKAHLRVDAFPVNAAGGKVTCAVDGPALIQPVLVTADTPEGVALSIENKALIGVHPVSADPEGA